MRSENTNSALIANLHLSLGPFCMFPSCTLLGWAMLLCSSCLGSSLNASEISEQDYEGRPQFVIKTQHCTWYFDRAGGGFSRCIDHDGNDWIQFSQSPLSKFPQSAAAGYRGIPNCVFVGPDKGAGHPGFNQCVSRIDRTGDAPRIVTKTKSGKWSWQWTFYEHYAEFEMLVAGNENWWFLYEGPLGGKYDPSNSFWATDTIRLTREIPDNAHQKFGSWQTLYAGRNQIARVLAIHQLKPDKKTDTLWYLGSQDGGSASSTNGMIVVGFGRGPGTKPQLEGAGQRFRIGLVATNEPVKHAAVLADIANQLQL